MFLKVKPMDNPAIYQLGAIDGRTGKIYRVPYIVRKRESFSDIQYSISHFLVHLHAATYLNKYQKRYSPL